ncbi:MAG: endonuclease/exonuclease/phosphatase family protein [Deltaproteobacteria bacterium]|nr:endonuclease/exonuclease/phosphatase family protein [Deltaproteobacteria bacterium]
MHLSRPTPAAALRFFPFVLPLLCLACSAEPAPLAYDGATLDSFISKDATAEQLAPDTLTPDLPLGPPAHVRVATFNVHNFFDGVDDPHHSDEILTSSEVGKKVKQIGAALRTLDADVVALQEIENLGLLNRIVTEELKGRGYEHVHLQSGNDPRGINVAVLSRSTITRVTSHAGDQFEGADASDTKNYHFSRDCLEVEIEPSKNRRLTLLINHLRAASFSDPDLATRIREAQAKRVRAIVDEILKWSPNANVAVVGDLNDAPTSRALTLLRDGSPRLTDLLASQSLNNRYTIVYKGKKLQFDYILTTPGLQADYETGSAKARHDAVFSAASDHFPVVANFRVE